MRAQQLANKIDNLEEVAYPTEKEFEFSLSFEDSGLGE